MGKHLWRVGCFVDAVLLLFFLSVTTAQAGATQNGPCTSSTTVCVTTWQQDTYRTGQNLQEGAIVAVNGGLGNFGELCSQQLDGQVYGQPLVATGVTINSVKYNYVAYVVTQNDTLYAIDGDPTDGRTKCGIIKSVPFLTTGATNGQYQVDYSRIGGGQISCQHTIGPWIGILGTPVMVTNGTTGTIYLVTETQDVPVGQAPNHWYHYIHAVDIQTMQEVATAVRIFPPGSDDHHKDLFSRGHIQRPGLLYLTATQARLTDPMVYIAFSMMDGAGTPNPNGAIFSYDASTLALQSYFPTSQGITNFDGGGIWMGGGGPAYGTDHNGTGWIYLSTANGVFDASSNWGDSVLMLDPSTLNLAAPTGGHGYFTPADQYYRSAYGDQTCTSQNPPGGDVDFGSGSVLLLPDSELANWGFLAINGDKEGGLWFTDRTNPNGYNSNTCGNTCPCQRLGGNNVQTFWTGPAFAGNVIHNGLAFWERPFPALPETHYLYVIPSGGVLTQYQLCALSSASNPICNGTGVQGIDPSTGQPVSFGYGATPTISAASSTATSAILWTTVANSNPQPTGFGGTLLAFDALTMTQLYSNHACKNRDELMPTTKFSLPTVANGNVYLGTYAVSSDGSMSIPNGMFYLFGLNASTCT